MYLFFWKKRVFREYLENRWRGKKMGEGLKKLVSTLYPTVQHLPGSDTPFWQGKVKRLFLSVRLFVCAHVWPGILYTRTSQRRILCTVGRSTITRL